MYPFYEARHSGNNDYFTIFSSKNITFPPHLHSYVELIYVLEGNIKISVNNLSKDLEKGYVAVIFPNDIHSYHTETSSNSKSIILIFSPDVISGYFSKNADQTLENPFIRLDSIEEIIFTLIDMLYKEHKSSKNVYVIKGFLYAIFGKLDSQFVLKDNIYSYTSAIQPLLVYIEGHYTKNITLDSIAKALGYSKFYLSRLFSNKIGYQFNDYVNRLRINMAQRLIKETDDKIFDIAMECGFESLRNFNRVFKGYTGVTPKTYRNAAESKGYHISNE